jgi:hypothetical protein
MFAVFAIEHRRHSRLAGRYHIAYIPAPTIIPTMNAADTAVMRAPGIGSYLVGSASGDVGALH